MEEKLLKEHASSIRRKIITMIYTAQSGHPGGSLSAADILTYLYFNEMNITKENIASSNRDCFVLA